MKYAFAIPMTQPRREMSTEKRVSLEDAIKMPKTYEDLSNDTLFILASMGNQEAREERLIREIMAVNKCTWEHAQPIFIEMCRANKVGMSIATLPYKVGILSAVTAAFASIPLVFDLNTVLWFNELFVTSGERKCCTYANLGHVFHFLSEVFVYAFTIYCRCA